MFDLKRLSKNKKRAKRAISLSPIFQFIHNDLIDRLQPIDRSFQEILIINPSVEELLIPTLKKKYPDHNLTIIDPFTQLPKSKFDLIIFPMGLHWISDVQSFLLMVFQALKQDGIFISNFPGSGSLHKLRHRLIELESIHTKGHAPHISPFIQFEQVVPLLQQAGFIENIIDMEKLDLEHNSALDLMKVLQNLGESNVLEHKSAYSINKKMYQDLLQIHGVLFTDQINLITFISSPKKNSIKLKNEHFHK